MGEFFGTDGFRGVAGQFPLDAQTIERIGYSLANELKARFDRSPLIIIVRDTRELGEWIEASIVRGIRTAQLVTRSSGIFTTSVLAYLTRSLIVDAGLII